MEDSRGKILRERVAKLRKENEYRDSLLSDRIHFGYTQKEVDAIIKSVERDPCFHLCVETANGSLYTYTKEEYISMIRKSVKGDK